MLLIITAWNIPNKDPMWLYLHYMNDCLLYNSFKQLVIQFHGSVRIFQCFVTPVSLFCLCKCALICFRADSLSSLHLKYALLLETDRRFFMMLSDFCVHV